MKSVLSSTLPNAVRGSSVAGGTLLRGGRGRVPSLSVCASPSGSPLDDANRTALSLVSPLASPLATAANQLQRAHQRRNISTGRAGFPPPEERKSVNLHHSRDISTGRSRSPHELEINPMRRKVSLLQRFCMHSSAKSTGSPSSKAASEAGSSATTASTAAELEQDLSAADEDLGLKFRHFNLTTIKYKKDKGQLNVCVTHNMGWVCVPPVCVPSVCVPSYIDTADTSFVRILNQVSCRGGSQRDQQARLKKAGRIRMPILQTGSAGGVKSKG